MLLLPATLVKQSQFYLFNLTRSLLPRLFPCLFHFNFVLYNVFFTGPLLYHFSDMVNEWSVELPYDDIRRIATEHFKFEMLVSFDEAALLAIFYCFLCIFVYFLSAV